MKKLATVVAGMLLAFAVGANSVASHDCPNQEQLLEKLGTIRVRATGRFVVKDHFATNSKMVKLAYLGDNFREHLLAKVEESQAGVELCYSRLKNDSLDALILAELGNQAETTLASIWELLKKQPNGESGVLLTNSLANIFYVRDANGVLWAVDVYWKGGGWRVFAGSFKYPREWDEGCQAFSRNS